MKKVLPAWAKNHFLHSERRQLQMQYFFSTDVID